VALSTTLAVSDRRRDDGPPIKIGVIEPLSAPSPLRQLRSHGAEIARGLDQRARRRERPRSGS